MADFHKAHKIIAQFEGRYSDDPNDRGGETFRGISRRFNASWCGWKILDQIKHIDGALDNSVELRTKVLEFYRSQYWDRLGGDYNPSELIAFELYDQAVNTGVYKATKNLQKSINRMETNFRLLEDGIYGRKTETGMIRVLDNGYEDVLYAMLNVLQGMHYINLADRDPKQLKYLKGWMRRVFYK